MLSAATGCSTAVELQGKFSFPALTTALSVVHDENKQNVHILTLYISMLNIQAFKHILPIYSARHKTLVLHCTSIEYVACLYVFNYELHMYAMQIMEVNKPWGIPQHFNWSAATGCSTAVEMQGKFSFPALTTALSVVSDENVCIIILFIATYMYFNARTFSTLFFLQSKTKGYM